MPFRPKANFRKFSSFSDEFCAILTGIATAFTRKVILDWSLRVSNESGSVLLAFHPLSDGKWAAPHPVFEIFTGSDRNNTDCLVAEYTLFFRSSVSDCLQRLPRNDLSPPSKTPETPLLLTKENTDLSSASSRSLAVGGVRPSGRRSSSAIPIRPRARSSSTIRRRRLLGDRLASLSSLSSASRRFLDGTDGSDRS